MARLVCVRSPLAPRRSGRSLSAMHSSSLNHGSVSLPMSVVLTAITVGVLCSGCFVIRREQFSKPVGPAESAKFHRISEGCETYSQLLSTPESNVEVSVANWPSGWELQFLLNVIPINRYHYGKTEPLAIDVQVEPKTSGLVLDPHQIFFVGTDQVRFPPAKTWHGSPPVHSAGVPIPITNSTVFHLEFPVEHRAYPEYDPPFQLCVEGLSVVSRSIPTPPITFESEAMTRPAFRLP